MKKYADSLWGIVKSRDINVNLRRNLIEVNSKDKVAIFEDLDDPKKTETISVKTTHLYKLT